jgi:hypothetical protein
MKAGRPSVHRTTTRRSNTRHAASSSASRDNRESTSQRLACSKLYLGSDFVYQPTPIYITSGPDKPPGYGSELGMTQPYSRDIDARCA